MRKLFILACLFALASRPSTAQDKTVAAGAHIGWLDVDELSTTDTGVGGWIAYRPHAFFAVEGALTYFPADIPKEAPVTSSRLEALFGMTAGPRFERFALFGKLRPGFVRFAEAPEPVACIAIFPPPLACEIARGKTVAAVDLGGGLEVNLGESSLLRVDLSSLLLRFEGPVLNRVGGSVVEGGFWSHNFRLTVGAGLRF